MRLTPHGTDALRRSAVICGDLRAGWAAALGKRQQADLEAGLCAMVGKGSLGLDVPGWFGVSA